MMNHYDLPLFHFGHTSLGVIFWNTTHPTRDVAVSPLKALEATAIAFTGQRPCKPFRQI